jgi:hypothetical protein
MTTRNSSRWALEHLRHNHPAARAEEGRVRQMISTRAYDIEYVVVYEGGHYGPEAKMRLVSV